MTANYTTDYALPFQQLNIWKASKTTPYLFLNPSVETGFCSLDGTSGRNTPRLIQLYHIYLGILPDDAGYRLFPVPLDCTSNKACSRQTDKPVFLAFLAPIIGKHLPDTTGGVAQFLNVIKT